MTSFDAGFFLALQEDPTDSTTRLVYADYLEDQGRDSTIARAEFIRVQIELDAITPLTPNATDRTAVLAAREGELLAEWERVWLGGWADILDGWAFRGGFVEAVRADASLFLDHAEEWFAEWPTLRVAKLTRAGGHLADLAESPWLAHLRGLDLSNNQLDSAALSPLIESRFVCLLEALDLSNNPIGARGAAQIATAWAFPELTELHLAGCELSSHGLDALCCGPTGRWRRLDLARNRLRRRDLVQLADSPMLRPLTALDLEGNPLGDNGASVLADSPNAVGLIHLGLCDTGVGNAELTSLARSQNLPRLRSLDLRGHGCYERPNERLEDRGGIGELSRSPLLGQLNRLLLGPPGARNGWAADVMKICRPTIQVPLSIAYWVEVQLRTSRYLVPSQMTECDLEGIWWLGDTGRRQRRPALWGEG